jgi:hypothetical protein
MGSKRIGLARTKALLDGLRQDINLGYDTSLVGDANTKIDFEKDAINLETNGAPQIKISGSNGEVTFNESYTFPYVDGTNNQVLVTDGSGSLSWANQAGGGGGSVRTVGVDTNGDGSTDNTLDASEDLILKAGVNVTLSEAGGVVTFNSTEVVVTGSTNTQLDTSYNGGTFVITPLSGDVTYTLPPPTSNFKVKFLAGSNLTGGDLILRTNSSAEKIFGLLYRISFGGDSDTGYDLTPQSYVGAAETNFVGGATEQHLNTITIVNAIQGTDIDFYSDGNYWYVRGSVVAGAASSGAASTITFSSGSY